MKTRPCSPLSLPCGGALVLLLVLCAVPVARAQQVVYVSGEPETDSLSIWASQAKAGFQSNLGDSAGGGNYGPYEMVGRIGRRMLRALGRKGLPQAHVIRPALDSLGLVTEVATDPAAPAYALLMVRNPARYTADAVGFLYWYRGDDLRLQGVVFKGGYHPRMRVWRGAGSGNRMECGILDETQTRSLRFTLLRQSPGSLYWGIQQDEESSPLLGDPGEAAWLDLNQDGSPEFVSWTSGATDSLFTECPNCPKLLTERTFIEDGEGFGLLDERLLPTPYATLVYFVRLLIDGKSAQAGKLVRDPAMVREAVAQGWGKRIVRKPWFTERRQDGSPWRSRLSLRFEGPRGVKHYVVIFAMREGRWIIDNWLESKPAMQQYPSVIMPPATSTPPPATKPPATPAKPPAKTR